MLLGLADFVSLITVWGLDQWWTLKPVPSLTCTGQVLAPAQTDSNCRHEAGCARRPSSFADALCLLHSSNPHASRCCQCLRAAPATTAGTELVWHSGMRLVCFSFHNTATDDACEQPGRRPAESRLEPQRQVCTRTCLHARADCFVQNLS